MTTGAADPLPRESSRIVLRRLAPSDLERFQAYRADPETGRYQGWQPLPDVAAARFIAQMHAAPFGIAGEWFQLGIAERDTGALIGDIGVCVRMDPQPHAEIGFTLAAAARGRGLATEAVRLVVDLLFEHTGVERIVAVTDARNGPSISLLERVGMRLHATAAALFRDEPCQEHLYVLDRAGRPNL
jgi:RimJ/RimL family protein N-acetyltransferase